MMDKDTLEEMAKRLWNSGNPKIDEHNRREWLKSVEFLGPKWIMLQKVEKKCAAQSGS